MLAVLLLAQAGHAAPTVTLGQIEAVAGGEGVAAWMDTGGEYLKRLLIVQQTPNAMTCGDSL